MPRISLFLTLVAGLSALPAGAQVNTRSVPLTQPKILQERHPTASFVFAPESPLDSQPVTSRTAGQMTKQDLSLETNARSSIAERARYAGLDFNRGKWEYRQIVCPAFQNHLFLRFTRDQGAGDVSVFTASIPRNGQGRVRIIPVQRRSYSLFSPAPVNTLTIAAFNQIRADERAVGPTPWVGISLCYAALAGARLPLVANSQPDQTVSSVLSGEADGATIMRLTDTVAGPRAREWELTYDRKGTLIKSRVTAVDVSAPKKVPAAHQVIVAPAPQAASATASTPPS